MEGCQEGHLSCTKSMMQITISVATRNGSTQQRNNYVAFIQIQFVIAKEGKIHPVA